MSGMCLDQEERHHNREMHGLAREERLLRHEERNLRDEAAWEARHGHMGAAMAYDNAADRVNREEHMVHHERHMKVSAGAQPDI